MKSRFILAFRLCGVSLIALGLLTVIHTLIDYPEAFLRVRFESHGGGYRTLDFSGLTESLMQLIPAFVGTAIYLLAGRLADAVSPPPTATGAQRTAFAVIRLLVLIVFSFALLELLTSIFEDLSLLDAEKQTGRMFREMLLAALRFLLTDFFGCIFWFVSHRLSRLIAVNLNF